MNAIFGKLQRDAKNMKAPSMAERWCKKGGQNQSLHEERQCYSFCRKKHLSIQHRCFEPGSPLKPQSGL